MAKRETFLCSDFRPMPKRALLKLKARDRVVVFWAKDNDPEDTRCDYETQTIEKWDNHYPEMMHTEEGYEWDLHRMEDDETVGNTTRGWVRFYYPYDGPLDRD